MGKSLTGRILFIDDDNAGREVALFNLRRVGYEITPAANGQEGLSLVDLERKVIESALKIKNGNMTQAAAFLRIPRHVLIYRLEKYGIRRGGSPLPQSGGAEYSSGD